MTYALSLIGRSVGSFFPKYSSQSLTDKVLGSAIPVMPAIYPFVVVKDFLVNVATTGAHNASRCLSALSYLARHPLGLAFLSVF